MSTRTKQIALKKTHILKEMKISKEILILIGMVLFYGALFGFGFFSVGWLMSGMKVILLNF